MTRGFVWADYVSDDGNTYALRVDADYAAQPDRGWTYPSPAGRPVYPRGWLPRCVVGLDEAGHPRKARCGTTSAPLWVGTVITFAFNASDETVHTAVVIETRQERRGAHP